MAPQVVCKLSGLWNEASPGAPLDALTRYMRYILDCFGAARVMWGSDWPVLERAGRYVDWHACALAQLTPDQHVDVTENTARRVYRL